MTAFVGKTKTATLGRGELGNEKAKGEHWGVENLGNKEARERQSWEEKNILFFLY